MWDLFSPDLILFCQIWNLLQDAGLFCQMVDPSMYDKRIHTIQDFLATSLATSLGSWEELGGPGSSWEVGSASWEVHSEQQTLFTARKCVPKSCLHALES